MKLDRSNKFDFCYYGQANSLRLKSSEAWKWASEHLWGYHLFCWRHSPDAVGPLHHLLVRSEWGQAGDGAENFFGHAGGGVRHARDDRWGHKVALRRQGVKLLSVERVFMRPKGIPLLV